MARGSDLYICQQHTTGAIKIGRSGDVKRRLKELLTGSPYPLKIILHLPGQGNLEWQMHERLKPYKSRCSRGEWFDYEGLSSLPDWMYEMMDIEDTDTWWLV